MKKIQQLIAATALFLLSAVAFAQTQPNSTYTFQQGHSGFWYSPETSGSGFNITVDSNRVVGVAAFTFRAPLILDGVEKERIVSQGLVYMVGAELAQVGQRELNFELFTPQNGAFFEGVAAETIKSADLQLRVLTCNTIEYTISYDLADYALVRSGRLQKLTGDLGGTCELDCRDPDFGPRSAQCGGRQ